MDKALYPMIFKRKSFHLFRETDHISQAELEQIEAQYKTFTPLVDDIQTAIRIVPANNTTCKRGQEYCILLYSERKDNYLQKLFCQLFLCKTFLFSFLCYKLSRCLLIHFLYLRLLFVEKAYLFSMKNNIPYLENLSGITNYSCKFKFV